MTACALGALSLNGAEPATKVSLTHVWMGDADLDGGGKIGSNNTDLTAGYNWSLGRGESFGLSVGASYRNYDFSGSNSNPLVASWNDVTEYSLGLGWRKPIGNDGLLWISPMVEVAAESGASWSDSVIVGGIVSYGIRISDTLTIGLGAGIFSGLEETNGFPILLVDWQISDQWRLGNSFRPGPAGPAGLEIAYKVNPEWEVALGGGWRSDRFRLDENGFIPNGIGEIEGVPVFIRLSWAANETISLDIYGGQFLSGQVTTEDRNGNELSSVDLDSAPIGALSITARF